MMAKVLSTCIAVDLALQRTLSRQPKHATSFQATTSHVTPGEQPQTPSTMSLPLSKMPGGGRRISPTNFETIIPCKYGSKWALCPHIQGDCIGGDGLYPQRSHCVLRWISLEWTDRGSCGSIQRCTEQGVL